MKGTNLSATLLLVNIPNANKPSNGPYVYVATFNITPIILGLFITLNIITNKRNTKAKTRWTIFLVLCFCLSVQSSLRFNPSMSIQNEDVSAVIAPSALGNRADIRAIIKITEMIPGTASPRAMVGNNRSGLASIPLVVA